MVAKCWINCHNSIFRIFNLKRIRFLLWGSNQIKRLSGFWYCVEVKLRFWNLFEVFLLPLLLVTLQQSYFPWKDIRVIYGIFQEFSAQSKKAWKERTRLMWCPYVVEFLCQCDNCGILQSLLEMIFKFLRSFCPSWTKYRHLMCVWV